MTRFFTALLAFYITIAIVQIPYVQSLMPGYVKEIITAEFYDEEEEYVEPYFISIIVPKSEFDPMEEDAEVYSKNLIPIEYDKAVKLLEKLPNVRQESQDYYYLKIDDIDIPVSFYIGDDEKQVTEIEFQIPITNLDTAKEVVECMAEMANDIQGSRFFDYNGKNLYEIKDQEALVHEILKNQ